MIKQTLLTMHRRALKLVCHRWFLMGFSLSGEGFNGERTQVRSSSAARALVTAHFNRVWSQEEARRSRQTEVVELVDRKVVREAA